MRKFYLISLFESQNKTFESLQDLIQYYDKHSGNYTHYIFAIPLLVYFRRDELPDLNDPKIREKYKLGERPVFVHPFDLNEKIDAMPSCE
jgi:hypothetical protein